MNSETALHIEDGDLLVAAAPGLNSRFRVVLPQLQQRLRTSGQPLLMHMAALFNADVNVGAAKRRDLIDFVKREAVVEFREKVFDEAQTVDTYFVLGRDNRFCLRLQCPWQREFHPDAASMTTLEEVIMELQVDDLED